METQPKLNNSKEVIAYLAKQFPSCFIAEGEAKPLKIGIFQDIISRLGDDSCISKTQLRSALRLYTTSWRYLYGIKVGAERVDLDGNGCGVLDQEHVDFAREQLEQAKAKVKALKREKRQQETDSVQKKPAKPQATGRKSSNVAKPKAKSVAKDNGQSDAAVKQYVQRLSDNDFAALKPGQKVKVKAGQSAMDAVILEISREGARVQLSSGMSMLIRSEHLVV